MKNFTKTWRKTSFNHWLKIYRVLHIRVHHMNSVTLYRVDYKMKHFGVRDCHIIENLQIKPVGNFSNDPQCLENFRIKHKWFFLFYSHVFEPLKMIRKSHSMFYSYIFMPIKMSLKQNVLFYSPPRGVQHFTWNSTTWCTLMCNTLLYFM